MLVFIIGGFKCNLIDVLIIVIELDSEETQVDRAVFPSWNVKNKKCSISK